MGEGIRIHYGYTHRDRLIYPSLFPLSPCVSLSRLQGGWMQLSVPEVKAPHWAEDAAAVGLEVWWYCWCPSEQKVSMSETHNSILMSHSLLIF